MKVKELIEELKAIDQNLDILCYSEDITILAKDQMIRLLEIDNVSVTECEIDRDDNRDLAIKIGKTESSHKVAFINVMIG